MELWQYSKWNGDVLLEMEGQPIWQRLWSVTYFCPGSKPWFTSDFSRSWCFLSLAWTQPPSPAVMGLLAYSLHGQAFLGEISFKCPYVLVKDTAQKDFEGWLLQVKSSLTTVSHTVLATILVFVGFLILILMVGDIRWSRMPGSEVTAKSPKVPTSSPLSARVPMASQMSWEMGTHGR